MRTVHPKTFVRPEAAELPLLTGRAVASPGGRVCWVFVADFLLDVRGVLGTEVRNTVVECASRARSIPPDRPERRFRTANEGGTESSGSPAADHTGSRYGGSAAEEEEEYQRQEK